MFTLALSYVFHQAGQKQDFCIPNRSFADEISTNNFLSIDLMVPPTTLQSFQLVALLARPLGDEGEKWTACSVDVRRDSKSPPFGDTCSERMMEVVENHLCRGKWSFYRDHFRLPGSVDESLVVAGIFLLWQQPLLLAVTKHRAFLRHNGLFSQKRK